MFSRSSQYGSVVGEPEFPVQSAASVDATNAQRTADRVMPFILRTLMPGRGRFSE